MAKEEKSNVREVPSQMKKSSIYLFYFCIYSRIFLDAAFYYTLKVFLFDEVEFLLG